MLIKAAKPWFRSFSLAACLISAGVTAGGIAIFNPTTTTLTCGVCADEWSLFNEGKRAYDDGKFGEAQRLWQLVLKQRSGDQSSDKVAMVTIHWLGYMFFENGREREALPLLLKAAEMNTAIYGPEHLDTLGAQSHIGQTLHALRKFDQAERVFNHILPLYKKRFGAEHASVAHVQDALGMIYYHQMRFRESEQILTENLNLNIRLFGENSFNVAQSHLSLGRMYRADTQLGLAKKHFRQAMEIANNLKGNYLDLSAISVAELGFTENFEGHFEVAEKMERKALEMSRASSYRAFIESTIREDLAISLIELDRFEEAARLINDSILDRIKMEGSDSLEVLNAKQILAGLLIEQKKYAEAEALLNPAMLQVDSQLEKDNIFRFGFLIDLGRIYRETGRLEKAELVLKECLALELMESKKEDVYTASARFNLGQVYEKMGRYKEAEQLLLASYKVRQFYFGSHPRTAVSLDGLGHLAMKRGHKNEAKKYFTEALSVRRKELGAKHNDTIESEQDLVALMNARI